MHSLGIPQDRIAKRLGEDRETIRNRLAKMPESALWPKADLSKGFTISRVAQKHGWTEPMVWAFALEGKKDLERHKYGLFKYYTYDPGHKHGLLKEEQDCDLLIFLDRYFGKLIVPMPVGLKIIFGNN